MSLIYGYKFNWLLIVQKSCLLKELLLNEGSQLNLVCRISLQERLLEMLKLFLFSLIAVIKFSTFLYVPEAFV